MLTMAFRTPTSTFGQDETGIPFHGAVPVAQRRPELILYHASSQADPTRLPGW